MPAASRTIPPVIAVADADLHRRLAKHITACDRTSQTHRFGPDVDVGARAPGKHPSISRGPVIGMGAVVTRDAPPGVGVGVVGNPPRVMDWG
jgi:serine acetyltransferase